MPDNSSPQGTRKSGEAGPHITALYKDADEGLKAVREDYLYWTAKLTDSSFQLSLALIAANWAVFGTVQKILNDAYAKWSLALVIISLALSLFGAKCMGELHLHRINYATGNPGRWESEFSAALGRKDPWPFTKGIEILGRGLREARTWFTLVAGALFLVALLHS
jgi:hypothetical protein